MKRLILVSFLIFSATPWLQAQIHEPVKWKITATQPNQDKEVTITFKAVMDKGWHINGMEMLKDGPIPLSFRFEEVENAEIINSTVSQSKPEKKYEPAFGLMLDLYENEAQFTQKVKINDGKNYRIKGFVEYMACNDKTCLPPTREPFVIGKEGETAASANETTATAAAPFNFTSIAGAENETDYWKPVIEELTSFGSTDSQKKDSLWIVFLKGLLGGLIAIVTPCVWPIIPMTVSFFLKRGKDPKKGKKAAIVYGISIILIYVVIGLIITTLFGASALNALSTNAIFNVLIFGLLVLFAISFFGGFDIVLPATWSTKIENTADKTTGFFSIFLMAFTLVIVSFSCTGPIVGTLLVDAVGGNILAPAVGMLGFAVALAVPFTVFAFFPSWLHNLPRSGGWLNSVKVILGFLELAFAMKFLSVADLAYGWNLLDREIFIAFWIVIFSLLGLYLLSKIRFRGDDPSTEVSVPRFFAAIFTFAFVVYLIPGLLGAPLKAISAFAPPMFTQKIKLYENYTVEAHFDDYDEAMQYAAKHNKPVAVDFSGFGCVNCRKMEAAVWSDPEVSHILNEEYVLVTLFVDDRKGLDHPISVVENEKTRQINTVGEKWSYLQRSKFGANAQPFYVLLDNKGDVLNKSYAFSENINDFIDFLKTGLENYKR